MRPGFGVNFIAKAGFSEFSSLNRVRYALFVRVAHASSHLFCAWIGFVAGELYRGLR